MAKSIFWREKVVSNFIAVVLTLLTLHTGAQSFQFAKITYSCKSTDLETVINDLSKLTGVSFIYSSNKITTSTPVSFSVKDKSLSEVLAILGKQLNLSFKIQDQHITVKANGASPSASLTEIISYHKIQGIKTIDENKEILAATKPYVPFNSEKMRKAVDLSNDGDVNQYLVKLQPYFNPSLLKNMPVSYIKSTARNLNTHRWFVSGGAVVNSYSTGVEMQAGLQKLYAVFSPTWMANNKFHGAFGVGTSFQIAKAFSLKPIYTYASVKESTTSTSAIGTVNELTYKVNSSASHHQVKLMLQYTVTRKFSLRAGPTFNYSRTISKYDLVINNDFNSQYFAHKPPGAMQPYEPPHAIHLSRPSQVASDVTTDKLWIGWEVAFAYRINF